MINVRCRTNLDNFSTTEWPKVMCCHPVKGDAVEDSSGRCRLYVVGVTHRVGANNLLDTELAGVPYLVVELHKWYKGLRD